MPNRGSRFLFIALAVGTALTVQAEFALAQANTNSEADGLNPRGGSSANGGLLAQVDSNANTTAGGAAGLNPATNSGAVVNSNINAQARSNEEVRRNAARDYNTNTRVGDASTRVGDVASTGRSVVGVGSTNDVNSSFNSGFNGSLNNGPVGVNNSTGMGLNATVGGTTAGNLGTSNTSVNNGARVGVGASTTGSNNAGTNSANGVTR